MTPAELHAKALRAAEWFNATQDKTARNYYQAEWDDEFKNGWDVWYYYAPDGDGKPADYSCPHENLSDRMMIAFAEDQGWEDQEPEYTKLRAKARMIAEWYHSFGQPVFETEDGMWEFEITEHERTAPITTEFFVAAAEKIDGWQDQELKIDGPITGNELLAFCEKRGWLDDHVSEQQEMVEPCADEEEALDCCARGMAQFMDEVDPDPIQLNQSVLAGIESHCRKVIEISNAEINASNSIESRAYYNGAKQAYRDILKMVAQHRAANEADVVEWEVKTLHMTRIGDWSAVAREEPDGGL